MHGTTNIKFMDLVLDWRQRIQVYTLFTGAKVALDVTEFLIPFLHEVH